MIISYCVTLITSTQNLTLNYDFEYKGVVFAFCAHLFKKKHIICFCFFLVCEYSQHKFCVIFLFFPHLIL